MEILKTSSIMMRPSVYSQDYMRYTSDPNYFKELEMRAKKLGYKDKQF